MTLPVKSPNPQHGPAIGPMAGWEFPERHIESLLSRIGLPKTSPLSVLAVEILPGLLNLNVFDPARNLKSQDSQRENETEDPVGRGLGGRRILRVSPLAAVPAIC